MSPEHERIARALQDAIDDKAEDDGALFDTSNLRALARELLAGQTTSAPSAAKFDEFSRLTCKLFASCRADRDFLTHPAAATLLKFAVVGLARYATQADDSADMVKNASARQQALAQAFGLTRVRGSKGRRLNDEGVRVACLSAGAGAYARAMVNAEPADHEDRQRAFAAAMRAAYDQFLTLTGSDPNARDRRAQREDIAALLRAHGYCDR